MSAIVELAHLTFPNPTWPHHHPTLISNISMKGSANNTNRHHACFLLSASAQQLKNIWKYSWKPQEYFCPSYTSGLIPSLPFWPLGSNQCNRPVCKNSNTMDPIFKILSYIHFHQILTQLYEMVNSMLSKYSQRHSRTWFWVDIVSNLL